MKKLVRSTAAVLLFFSVVTSAYAAPKPNKDYWKNAALSFDLIRKYVSNSSCNSTADEVFACAAAINSLLGSGGQRLVPKHYRNELRPHPAIVELIEPFALIREDASGEEDPAPAAWAGLKPWEQKLKLKDLSLAYRNAWAQVMTNGKVDFESLLERAKKEVIREENESVLTGQAISAYLRTRVNPATGMTDPHARLESREEMDDLANSDDAIEAFSGIGAGVQKDPATGFTQVLHLIEGGSAETSGLLPGDLIVSIDGKPTTSLTSEAAAAALRGTTASELKLQIQRDGKPLVNPQGQPEWVLKRQIVQQKRVGQKLLRDGANAVGYVSLTDFMYERARDEIKKAIQGFIDRQTDSRGKSLYRLQGLILDLRGNRGGFLQQATDVANLFLDKGAHLLAQKEIDPDVIAQAKRNGQKTIENFYAQKRVVTRLPLIVLIDPGSASASEIVAGIIQEYGRGLILGQRSFGKGCVQSGDSWEHHPEKIRIFKTTATYHLPLLREGADRTEEVGRTPQGDGIQPDIEVLHKPRPAGGYTEEDRFVQHREEDLSDSFLKAGGEKYVPQRPDYADKIRNCVEAGGSTAPVNVKFAGEKAAKRRADYPLLYAQAAMACMVQTIVP